ncbi:predicted protein [Histoplasma mississippiense (nom. inval.)]|uniref:predicted protein n=1 Tax=Ajellomyces capsulatus (strain NAm1 / WU24) TaxID=2059318 RepID=UPI000157C9F1|nr:predicted protein [Histoplasma mississippiense (nom. inval.)]EDN09054.1 predicted protein [Histoplasma mississippiense (nom. inval.)]
MAPINDVITVKETNEIGAPTATYIYSTTSDPTQFRTPDSSGVRHERRRVDIVLPSRKDSSSYLASLLNVFLPVGYPHSVSDDYLDCLGFASGVLKFNCRTTGVPGCIASTPETPEGCSFGLFERFKSAVWCGCWEFKSELEQSFCEVGKFGRVKCLISLLGMLCGSVVVSHISTPSATWTTLLLLLLVHLSTNYAAVRSVNMTTLNRQRANIVFSTLFEKGSVLTPTEASKCERIFERDGILRWKASPAALGYCQIGGSFQELLRGSIHGANSIRDVGIDIYKLLRLFEKEEYVLWFNPIHKKGTIVLKNNVTPISQLKAWSHALIVAKRLTDLRREEADMVNVSTVEKEEEEDKWKQRNESVSVSNFTDPDTMFSILESTLCAHSASFADQIGMLTDAGWDVATPSLETRPARRFEVVEFYLGK